VLELKELQKLMLPVLTDVVTVSVACAFFVSDNSGTSVIFSSPEGSPDSIL
jgi:hypothetical protein